MVQKESQRSAWLISLDSLDWAITEAECHSGTAVRPLTATLVTAGSWNLQGGTRVAPYKFTRHTSRLAGGGATNRTLFDYADGAYSLASGTAMNFQSFQQ